MSAIARDRKTSPETQTVLTYSIEALTLGKVVGTGMKRVSSLNHLLTYR
jgi:hypothetical protein